MKVIALYDTGDVDEAEAIRRLKLSAPFQLPLVFGADALVVDEMRLMAEWSKRRAG